MGIEQTTNYNVQVVLQRVEVELEEAVNMYGCVKNCVTQGGLLQLQCNRTMSRMLRPGYVEDVFIMD